MCCCRLQLNPDGVHLYCFPKDLARRKNWANQVRRTRDKWEPSDHSRLCSKHSENDCFETYGRLSESLGLGKTKSLLKPDADYLPSLRSWVSLSLSISLTAS